MLFKARRLSIIWGVLLPWHAPACFAAPTIVGPQQASTEVGAYASDARQPRLDWLGNVALKNNYVFSTGTEIDDKPVAQLWLRGIHESGFFIDLWANAPLQNGNPRRSAEIDYSIGYSKDMDEFGTITTSLSYYDLQTPDLFQFDRDVLGVAFKWQTRWKQNHVYSEAMGFVVDDSRNGFRIENSFQRRLNQRLSVQAKINYADGPYQRQAAVIAKLALHYRNSNTWINGVSLEHSDIVYAEDAFDPRDSATTFSLIKDLF